MRKKVFKILSWGGLGDAMMATPSFKSLKSQYPGSRLVVYCDSAAHWDIFRHNPYIDSLRRADSYAAYLPVLLHRLRWKEFLVPNYGWLRPSTIYRKHAVEIIAESLGLELTDRKLEVFLTPAEEEKARQLLAAVRNPVVINPTSRSSKNQEWAYDRWEEVIRQLPDYTFLQLGLPDEHALAGAVDLRGKISLREAMAVVKYSRGVVGVDSFFGHVAEAMDKPAVTLFGASNPEVWGYPGSTSLYKKTACAPCIDVLGDDPCPYNRKCMQQIGTPEVVAAIAARLSY